MTLLPAFPLSRRRFLPLLLPALQTHDPLLPLLAQVAANYASFRSLRIVANIAAFVEGQPGGRASGIGRSTNRTYDLSIHPGAVRLSVANAGAKPAISYISSDNQILVLFHFASQFLLVEATHPQARSILDEINKYRFHLVDRYARLPHLDVQRKSKGASKLKANATSVQCDVVELTDRSPAAPWTDRLWIDPSSALIWKSSKTWSHSPAGAGGEELTTVLSYDLNPSFPPDTFSTTPPPDYRPRTTPFSPSTPPKAFN